MMRNPGFFTVAILSLLGTGLPLTPLESQEKATEKKVETQTIQVFSDHTYTGKFVRSKRQERAVLLIHGLRPQLNATIIKNIPKNFQALLATPEDAFIKANMEDWQRHGSPLVSHLSKTADVFSFAYGQNVSLEKIADGPGLANAVEQLKSMGYSEIVLMGHSAGGVLARLFVEDNPASGVTKVIQVCVPNGGTFFAKLSDFVPKGQEAFVQSLSEESRNRSCQTRKAKKIPAAIQFVCIVGTLGKSGDGVVSCPCQWPEDLQEQGIPAVQLPTNHFVVMSQENWPKKLSFLVQEQHPRWNKDKVLAFKQSLDENEVTRSAYFTTIQSRAEMAHKEADIETLVACAYALAPYDSPAGIEKHLPFLYLKQAAQLTLAKNDKQEADRFLASTGILQGLLGADTRDKLATLAVGKTPDAMLKGEVIASLGSIDRAGRDFFDPDVVIRGDDEGDVAAALGKALVLAVRPTARIDGLASHQIGLKKKSETTMELAMDFHGGTARHRAIISLKLSLEKNRVRIANVVYRDDWLIPWERSRIEEFESRFNKKP